MPNKNVHYGYKQPHSSFATIPLDYKIHAFKFQQSALLLHVACSSNGSLQRFSKNTTLLALLGAMCSAQKMQPFVSSQTKMQLLHVQQLQYLLLAMQRKMPLLGLLLGRKQAISRLGLQCRRRDKKSCATTTLHQNLVHVDPHAVTPAVENKAQPWLQYHVGNE